ncbi:MAG: hypothetical protein ACR2HP_01000 [Ilumatobacteraceae bacterium]
MNRSSTEPTGIAPWAVSNIAWLSSLLLVVFGILKVYSIAHLSSSTAQEVVRSSGVAEVATGVLLENIDLVVYVLGVLIIGYGVSRGVPRESSWTILTPLGCVLIMLVWLMDWALMLVLATVLIFNYFVVYRRSAATRLGAETLYAAAKLSPTERAKIRRSRFKTGAWLSLVAIVPLVISLMSGEPWLPRERITRTVGDSVVGFVLQDAGPWTVVLVDADRSILRIPSDAVLERIVCRQHGGVARPTMLRWISDTKTPNYPVCSDR